MKIFLIIIPLIVPSLLNSEDFNSKLTNDIERLSKDVQDLQKFIYSDSDNNLDQSKFSDHTNNSSVKISDIENTLKKINSRLEDLEIKIDDLYSLYLNKNDVTLSTVTNDDIISLEEESSSIVSKKIQTKNLVN